MSVTAPREPGTAVAGHFEQTVADLFLEALANAGVDYLFTVLGSDHPSIIEAYIKRQNAGKAYPRMLLFQHELVAISAADGYARVTRRAQVVIVHVDVGTAALGQGLHNASTGKAPVLIFAGLAPLTLYGELAGSRSEHVQWYQDVPNQADIVRPFSRYSNEIRAGEHVFLMVNRAILMATTGSPGPTYLAATREVLAAPCGVDVAEAKKLPLPTCRLGGLPQDAVEAIGKQLLKAEKPLVVTGYLGQSHEAVRKLVELADLVEGLKVFDSEQREMNFPASHPAWITRTTGAGPAVSGADLILVLDADVPWIPTKVRPSPAATIYHVDKDPRKEKMNLFDIYATETFAASSELALAQLVAYVTAHSSPHGERATKRKDAHAAARQAITARAAPNPDGSITNQLLFHTLGAVLPADAICVSDAVTNGGALHEQLARTRPGSWFTKGGSGLGWSGGAAIGVKLATERWDVDAQPPTAGGKAKLVCAVVGDGSFMFGVPSAVYWASHRLNAPFLTVVVNNGGWKATRSCINDVHKDGVAAKTSDRDLGIDLSADGPSYGGIAREASNGNVLALKVERASELEATLKKGLEYVLKEGKSALVDAVVR